MAVESAYAVRVDRLISADDDEITREARLSMVSAAIERYSYDRPDEVTEDITGDGGRYYGIVAELASWSEGFSRIVAIEYPAPTVASDETPIYLDQEDWDDNYWDGSTRYLFLPNHAPAAAEALRVTYTAPYILSSGAYSTPAQDFSAICNLAAGLTAQAIANKYSRTIDSTISADSVDHLSRADQWSRRARELMTLYTDYMGIGGPDGTTQPGTGDFVDWDTAPGWPTGRRYLFHGHDTR
jgi:hypothetical protein